MTADLRQQSRFSVLAIAFLAALAVAVCADAERAFAGAACSPDTNARIWVPAADDAPADNWAALPTEKPMAVLNSNAIPAKLAAPLQKQVQAALDASGTFAAKDSVVTLRPKVRGNPPSLAGAFQDRYHTYQYFPAITQDQTQTIVWVSGLVKSLGVDPDVALQVIGLTAEHCFRGAMIFRNFGGQIQSLFIWNAEALTGNDIKEARCLMAVFLRRRPMQLTAPDDHSRRFLTSCEATGEADATP